MPYTYHTDDERREMLDRIGVESEEDLFDAVPSELRLDGDLPIAPGKSEPEVLREFSRMAARNRPAASIVSFLGGGVYDHTVPPIVDNLTSRPEFATAYTPYQPEVSQGTLQVIFEFQTHVSRLTGLPVANASMYDAATATAEAALLCAKVRGRDRVLCALSVNPRYRRVVVQYARGQHVTVEFVPFDPATGQLDTAVLEAALGDDVAGVIVQTPNYFGILEAPWSVCGAVHEAGALLVAVVDPVSLALFREPGDYGADIAVGEGQALGIPVSFGGPLLGYMACTRELVRRIPGRIVSATTDVDGREAFVLTLQTREQHIRREKATSNICSNQGLMATRATIFLSLLGEHGLVDLARASHANAHRLAEMIDRIPGFESRFSGPFFRELVVRCPRSAERVAAAASERGVLAGIPMSRYFGPEASNDLLVATTEKHRDEDLDLLRDALRGQ